MSVNFEENVELNKRPVVDSVLLSCPFCNVFTARNLASDRPAHEHSRSIFIYYAFTGPSSHRLR